MSSGNGGFEILVKYVYGEKDDGGRSLQRFLRRLIGRAGSGEDVGDRVRRFVVKTIRRAKRRNLWWRFNGVGRRFLGLVVRLPVSFRSSVFLRALVKTLRDLLLLLDPSFRFFAAGYETAQKVSEAAYRSWGVKDALSWMNDRSFAICWGMFKGCYP